MWRESTMKKIICLLIAIVMMGSLIACNKVTQNTDDTENTKDQNENVGEESSSESESQSTDQSKDQEKIDKEPSDWVNSKHLLNGKKVIFIER